VTSGTIAAVSSSVGEDLFLPRSDSRNRDPHDHCSLCEASLRRTSARGGRFHKRRRMRPSRLRTAASTTSVPDQTLPAPVRKAEKPAPRRRVGASLRKVERRQLLNDMVTVELARRAAAVLALDGEQHAHRHVDRPQQPEAQSHRASRRSMCVRRNADSRSMNRSISSPPSRAEATSSLGSEPRSNGFRRISFMAVLLSRRLSTSARADRTNANSAGHDRAPWARSAQKIEIVRKR
jgi:hypothetical protein